MGILHSKVWCKPENSFNLAILTGELGKGQIDSSFMTRKLLLIQLGMLFVIPFKLFAWNEDYRPESFAVQRTVCLKKASASSKSSEVRSIPPDEPCEKDEKRYTLVVGTEPKGSYALIPLKYPQDLYPPWVVSWPAGDEFAPDRLWHFTCFEDSGKIILGTQTKDRIYKGEITTRSDVQSCESAYTMASKVCTEEMGGNEIFEQCLGSVRYSEP
jgi:hypothetical protein